jgi:hypothetical protein
VVATGGGGSRRTGGGHASWVFTFLIVFQKSLPRAISALGTRVPSGIHVALGIGLFAGPTVPSALCRK